MSNPLDSLSLRQRRQPLHISTDVPLFTNHLYDSLSGSPVPVNQGIISSEAAQDTGNPQCLFHVLCLHDFESSDPVHLPFHEDEVLAVIKQERSGWWAAMRPQGDRIGWIPGSFVVPLDGKKITGYPDEILWPYKSLIHYPLSAIHEPWVPVSEDHGLSWFHLVTPTDLVLYEGLFDDGLRSHSREFCSNLSNDERSPDMEHICVLPTPENPPLHTTESMYFPPTPLLSESALQSTRPPLLLDAAPHRHARLRTIGDQTPPLGLKTSVISDEVTPESISQLKNVNNWLAALESVSASQVSACFDDGRSQFSESPAILHPARPSQGISNFQLLDLMIWGPDNLAEQFCVLMHTLYATICPQDCLDWIIRPRSADMTGLRQFLDVHDRIASWVQRSIIAYCGDVVQRADILDLWIRVAETCRTLHNFDSLSTIILSLSRSSPASQGLLGSAWARCTRKQTLAMLHGMLDASNQFRRLVDGMNATERPSVPFVRQYLEHIQGLHVESPSRQSGRVTGVGSAAVRGIQFSAI